MMFHLVSAVHFLYKCITGIYARDAEIEILYLGFMTKFEFDKKEYKKHQNSYTNKPAVSH